MVEAEGDAAWDQIVREYDQYSLYEFLRFRGWSTGAIEYFAVMNFLESDMHNALVEILREDLGGAYVDMQEIAGGMDQLPNAFYRELRGRGPARGRGLRHRPGRRLGDRPLQDRGRPLHRARRLRHLHAPVLGAAVDRGPDPASRTGSSGRSGSSTTTPRPRSCSRSASASGRPMTASSAAPPSPTCRSAG